MYSEKGKDGDEGSAAVYELLKYLSFQGDTEQAVEHHVPVLIAVS